MGIEACYWALHTDYDARIDAELSARSDKCIVLRKKILVSENKNLSTMESGDSE